MTKPDLSKAVPAADANDQSEEANAEAVHANVVRKIWSLLTDGERRQLKRLLPLTMAMALFEAAGIASIVPFLALLSNPNAIQESQFLSFLYDGFGFESRNAFFFVVGLGVVVVITVGNAIAAFTTWRLLRFAWLRNDSLSTRLLESYLERPYNFFLTANSADLSKNVLAEVQYAVSGVIVQCVYVLARFTVVTAVTIGLLVIDPLLAIGALVVFGGMYGSLFWFVRKRITRAGRGRLAANEKRYRLASEALVGVKEVKLYDLISTVLPIYQKESRRFAILSANNAALAQVPRYALETIAFGGVLAIVLYMLATGSNLARVLPTLGLFAFAAYRVLPGLQTIFAGMTSIRFNVASLEIVQRDLVHSREVHEAESDLEPVSAPMPFKQHMELSGVRFAYGGSPAPVLADFNVAIAPGEWVALVGPTGSGKSTTVDIMLGFLEPSDGVVIIDGKELRTDADRRCWQRNCAYVPQQIFIADDTVGRNICFGIPPAKVDRERMERAARVARIHDFISEELSDGYSTEVGERGIRLSGGQRQRIGIARALYRAPNFLVLDEATSALDSETEEEFFSALRSTHSDTAVISIAHRLSTTRGFDRVVLLDRGAIIATGTYAELSRTHPYFASERTNPAR